MQLTSKELPKEKSPNIDLPQFSIPVYLINLPRAIARRKNCLQQLEELGIKPKLVAAHDGHSPTFPFHRYHNLSPFLVSQKKSFKPGAFACYLSHAECWKQIAHGNESYGLILEDDIVLNKSAFSNFNLNKYQLDEHEFDIIFVNERITRWLQYLEEKQWVNKDFIPFNDVLIKALINNQFLNYAAAGGDGYLVSKKGAVRLLENMKRYKIDMSPDYAMVFHSINPEGIMKINSLSEENIRKGLVLRLKDISLQDIMTEAPRLHLNSFIYSGVPLVTLVNNKENPSTLDHSKRIGCEVFEKPISQDRPEPNNLNIIEGKIVSSNYGKHSISFFVQDEKDVIQKFHARGKFCGVEDLEMISSAIPKPGVVLDIGSNIGNHTVYFAKIMKAEKVICIEPNFTAVDLLKTNVSINTCTNVYLGYLGIGLSDRVGSYQVDISSNNNLEATKSTESQQDTTVDNFISNSIVPVIPGDVLFSSIEIDLIKIDVEDMELSVIKGLEKTINKCKPVLFVKITDTHVCQVMEYLSQLGYYVIYQNKQHLPNTNYLLTYGGV